MTAKRYCRLFPLVLLICVGVFGLIPQVLAAESFDSLYAAIEAANSGSGSGTIELSEDIELSAPLPAITGEITIQGKGHSISGEGQYRIFDVNGGTLVINSLTLTEGSAEIGGAIRLRNGAQVTIDDSIFADNKATNGGAIATSNRSDRLTVSGSSFLSNKADKNAAAIYANGGTISITRSSFEKNCAEIAAHIVEESRDRASQDRSVDSDGCLHVTYHWPRPEDILIDIEGNGGAIRLLNGARFSAEAATFSKNKAINGGAIASTSGNVTLTISGSSFLGNFAEDNAGAIYIDGGITQITQSSFLNNNSENSGGALVGDAGEIQIANSTFYNNRASRAGGVIAVSGAEATITHVTMIKNRATNAYGDAIEKTDGIVNLRNSIIASVGGVDDCAGGLDQVAGNLSTDGTCGLLASDDPLLDKLTGTPAWYPLLDFSPAVDAADPEFCLETDQVGTVRPHGGGCDIGAFESTTALPKPPPIEPPPPPCPLALKIVAANTDAPAGGCPAGSGHDIISLTRDITLDAPLPHISSDVTIEGNGYTINGGGRFRIFTVNAGTLTINNLTLTDGKATRGGNESGGALRLEGTGHAVVTDSMFIKNLSIDGGAIGLASGATKLTVNGSSFVENQAYYGGGAISANGKGRITITNSSFLKNRTSSSGSGGAIYALSANSVDISNSTFLGNVSNRGGALSARWATVTLTHVTMLDNAAYGTGIYIEKDPIGAFRLRNSLIVGRGNVVHCYGKLDQNIGNFIADGSCSPKLSGDPILEELTGSPDTIGLQADSPAVDAADARFCPDTDQNGAPRVGLCDIGAIESIPVSWAVSDCSVSTTHNLRFRDGPGGSHIGSVPQDSTLAALARTPGWFNVEYQDNSGWISADYVVTQGDCE